MSIFSRFKDIISSNINSMLDDAEDPEKLIRLMLREMEETLVELKSGCAATMAAALIFCHISFPCPSSSPFYS